MEELARAGRPMEALAASTPADRDSRRWPLDEGMFFHAAERFTESQLSWGHVSADADFTDVERVAFVRLQQLNQAAIDQDATVLADLFAPRQFGLLKLNEGQASIIVVVESGWAPVPHPVGDINVYANHGKMVTWGMPPAMAVTPDLQVPNSAVRLNGQPEVQPKVVFDDTAAWAEQTLARCEALRAEQIGPETITFTEMVMRLGHLMSVWWSPPTRIAAIELVARPGPNVVTLPTAQGPQERTVQLAPGQRLILVMRL